MTEMISVNALLDRNYIKPQWAKAMLWWRNQSPVHHFSGYFHQTSSHRHHQMSARNVDSVCSYGTNSWHTIPCTSKHHTATNVSAYFRQGDPMLSSVMTSERKCEWLTFFLSVLVWTDAILIVSSHQSVYKAQILTQSITNSISCQNLMA